MCSVFTRIGMDMAKLKFDRYMDARPDAAALASAPVEQVTHHPAHRAHHYLLTKRPTLERRAVRARIAVWLGKKKSLPVEKGEEGWVRMEKGFRSNFLPLQGSCILSTAACA